MTLDTISQLIIILISPISIILVARVDDKKRWGYVFGLCGQPFWFYSFILNEQWGMVLITIFYTYGWIKGIWNYWIIPARVEKTRRSNDSIR